MRKTDKHSLDTLVEQVVMSLDEIARGEGEPNGTLYFEAPISGLDLGKTRFIRKYLHLRSAQNSYFARVIESRTIMHNGEPTTAHKKLIDIDLGRICSCLDDTVAIAFKPDYYYFYLSRGVEHLLSRDEYYRRTLAE